MDDRRVWGACVCKGRKPQCTPHSTLACLPVVSHSISSCGNQSRLLTSPIACAARFMGFLRPCMPKQLHKQTHPTATAPTTGDCRVQVCRPAADGAGCHQALVPPGHPHPRVGGGRHAAEQVCVGPLLGIMQDQQDQQAAHISTTPVAHENTHTQSAACIHAPVHMRTGVSSCTAVV